MVRSLTFLFMVFGPLTLFFTFSCQTQPQKSTYEREDLQVAISEEPDKIDLVKSNDPVGHRIPVHSTIKDSLEWAPQWIRTYGPVEKSTILQGIKDLWISDKNNLDKLVGLQFLPSGYTEKELFIAQGLLADLFREDGLWVDAYPIYRGLYVLDPSPGLAFRLSEYHQFFEKNYMKSQFFFDRARAFFPNDPTEKDIMLFLRKYWAFEPLKEVNQQLGDPNISVVKRHRDDLWIGTWNGGLIRYSFSERRARSFFSARSSIQPLTVRALAFADDVLYVGTYQGLFKYHLGRDEWRRVSFPDSIPLERIQSILYWRGKLMVATLGEGLWSLENESWTRPPVFSSHNFITSIAESADGALLVGTLNDGAFITRDLRATESLWDQRINNATFFLQDRQDNLWIGTYGNGLFRRGSKGWEHYTKANSPLEDDWILSAVEGQEGVYFGSFGQGLIRFYQDQWSKNDQWDGIPSRDISSLAHVSDRLVIGTLGEGVLMWEEDWYE
jgi:ligand-binding sensor domain-containing protein